LQLVVLAAGKGKRLRPITETRPKPLVPILDKPLIYWLLKRAKGIGIERSIIVVSYLKEQIINTLSTYINELGVDVKFIDQKEELGTGHALMRASNFIDDDALVIYGDLFINGEVLRKVITRGVKCNKLVISGVEVEKPQHYGVLVIEGDKVMDIVEKPGEQVFSNLVNAGIYYIPHRLLKLLNLIQLSPRGEYELTDLVKIIRNRGEDALLVTIDNKSWMDIGRPWDIIEANKRALQYQLMNRIIKGDLDRHVTIKGPVYIGEGAKVKAGSYIIGPVYISEEAEIGPNAYLRSYTVLGKGSRAGFSVEVKESVIFENVRASHLSYIGDSVVCEHVNLGAGTVIANLRFDNRTVRVMIEGEKVDSGRRKLGAFIGAKVKTGINVSIMPGVKIGSRAVIYPGVTVYRDVPSGAIVKENWK